MFFHWYLLVGIAVATILPQQIPDVQTTPQRPATSVEDLQIAYADVCLQLAEVKLQIALDHNRSMPQLHSKLALLELEQNVQSARAYLENLQKREGTTVQGQLRNARKLAKLAEEEYQGALRVRQAMPSMMPELTLERLRLESARANLKIRMWESSAYVPSLIDQMQWQIERLSEEVVDLHRRLDAKQYQSVP